MTKRTPQNVKLIKILGTGKNLTVSEAEDRFGIQRLSARIYELRRYGFTIYTHKVKKKVGTRRVKYVTAYRLNVDSSTRTLVNRFTTN